MLMEVVSFTKQKVIYDDNPMLVKHTALYQIL